MTAQPTSPIATNGSAPRSWRQAFLWSSGLPPLLLAPKLYKFVVLSASQLPLPRMVGLYAVAALVFLAFGALLTPLSYSLGPRLRDASTLTVGAFALGIFNLVIIGQLMFVANWPWCVPLSQVLGLVLVAAFALKPQPERVVTLGLLCALVDAGLCLPLLASPTALYGAMHYRPHLPESPMPPDGAAVRPDAPRRVILVTLDALSYNATSLANPRLDTTPNLAALARSAHVFERCYAASDRTIISLPALLTGVPPSDFVPTLCNRSLFIPEGSMTGLKEFLSPAGFTGYYSTCFVTPQLLSLGGDFTRGFCTNLITRDNAFNMGEFLPLREAWHWVDEELLPSHPTPMVHPLRAATQVFTHGVEMLRNDPQNTFLWVHVGLPHQPYFLVPKRDLRPGLRPEDYHPVIDPEHAPPAKLALLKQAYASNLRYADYRLGRFIAALKHDKLWDDSLVIVTSDHGEIFEPKLRTHAHGVINEAVSHVPLLIHLPGQQAAVRHTELASHVDIVPTVLALVYEKVPDGFKGHALLGPAATAPHPVFSWAEYTRYTGEPNPEPGQVAVFDGNYRYTWRWPDGEERLVDPSRDERRDLASELPGELQRLREAARPLR